MILAGEGATIAAELADTLAGALAAPIFMDQMWHISAGIGTAQAPADGTTGDEVQRHAASALRTAKRGGRGSVRRFVPEIHREDFRAPLFPARTGDRD